MGGGHRGGVRTDTQDRQTAAPKAGVGGRKTDPRTEPPLILPHSSAIAGVHGAPLASWVMDGDICLRPTPLPSDFLF